MTMVKEDFEFLATTIRKQRQALWPPYDRFDFETDRALRDLAERLEEGLKERSPTFDPVRFIQACRPGPPQPKSLEEEGWLTAEEEAGLDKKCGF